MRYYFIKLFKNKILEPNLICLKVITKAQDKYLICQCVQGMLLDVLTYDIEKEFQLKSYEKFKIVHSFYS